jgi:L,D-peptidoglycan transpeptidase YkuD (ErfK/YbiS/YcfS/YnhG family)
MMNTFMGRGVRIFFKTLLVIFFIAGIIWLLVRQIPEPPAAEMQFARNALAEAREKNAASYSPNTFRMAVSHYDSAMVHWRLQNERFILARDYSEVIRYAGLSAGYSVKAADHSSKSSTTLKSQLETRIAELSSVVSRINNHFFRYPLPSEVRNRISRGKMLLSEAIVAYNKGSYLQANRKITDAGSLLGNSLEYATNSLAEYFSSYPQWKSWMEKTIAESKQKKIAVIIVDKFAGKCYLYQNGVRKAEYDAELGKSWIGDKRQRGDNTTPEGIYHITKKLEGGATKYYKALMINYPNDDDKKRFNEAVKSGALPASARIGGLIEIHGHGGKGDDWTEGCVALTDADMDKLYKLVRVGTPVTIIGSAESLSTINGKQNGQ